MTIRKTRTNIRGERMLGKAELLATGFFEPNSFEWKSLVRETKKILKEAFSEGRNQGLEEGADKVFQIYDYRPSLEKLVGEILALKTPEDR